MKKLFILAFAALGIVVACKEQIVASVPACIKDGMIDSIEDNSQHQSSVFGTSTIMK